MLHNVNFILVFLRLAKCDDPFQTQGIDNKIFNLHPEILAAPVSTTQEQTVIDSLVSAIEQFFKDTHNGWMRGDIFSEEPHEVAKVLMTGYMSRHAAYTFRLCGWSPKKVKAHSIQHLDAGGYNTYVKYTARGLVTSVYGKNCTRLLCEGYAHTDGTTNEVTYTSNSCDDSGWEDTEYVPDVKNPFDAAYHDHDLGIEDQYGAAEWQAWEDNGKNYHSSEYYDLPRIPDHTHDDIKTKKEFPQEVWDTSEILFQHYVDSLAVSDPALHHQYYLCSYRVVNPISKFGEHYEYVIMGTYNECFKVYCGGVYSGGSVVSSSCLGFLDGHEETGIAMPGIWVEEHDVRSTFRIAHNMVIGSKHDQTDAFHECKYSYDAVINSTLTGDNRYVLNFRMRSGGERTDCRLLMCQGMGIADEVHDCDCEFEFPYTAPDSFGVEPGTYNRLRTHVMDGSMSNAERYHIEMNHGIPLDWK
jgi:hypothetical protein